MKIEYLEEFGTKETVLAYLKELKTCKASRQSGICYGLKGLKISTKTRIFKAWSEYSGNPIYPVPCPVDQFTPYLGLGNATYIRAHDVFEWALDWLPVVGRPSCYNRRFWDGKYGESRLSLLDHMITCIEDN